MKPVYTGACLSCPIYEKVGCFPVPPRVGKGGEIVYLVIGEAPGRTEIEKREPLIGKVGQPFRRAMEMAGVDLERTILTNATWCAPPGEHPGSIGTPSAEEAYSCLSHSFALVWAHRPKAIYLVGGVALKAVCGSQRTITKEDGNLYRLSDFLPTLPRAVRWGAFQAWAGQHPELIGDVGGFSPQEDPVAVEACMADADARWGWSKLDGYNPALIPTLHPSYAERQGSAYGSTNLMSPEWERIKSSLRRGVEFAAGGHEEARAAKDYRAIRTIAELESYVNETIALHEVGICEVIAVDTETSEEFPEDGIWKIPYSPVTRVLTVQISRAPDEAVMIFVNHRDSLHNDPASTRIVAHHLSRLIHAVPVVGHHYIGFDYNLLRNKLGIKDYRMAGDTLLEDHWLNMGRELPASLEDLEQRYIGGGHKYEARAWRKNNPGKTFEDMPADVALVYACGDADGTRKCHYAIKAKLEAEGRWESYYEFTHGKHGVAQYVVDLMHAGMPIDPPRLQKMLVEMPPKVEAAKEQLNRTAVVQAFLYKKFLAETEEDVKYNAGLDQAGDKRKKRRFIYPSFDAWFGNPDNRFNAASVPQTDTVFDMLNLVQFASRIPDIGYRDRSRNAVKADEANRTLFGDFFESLAKGVEKAIAEKVKVGPDGAEIILPQDVPFVADMRSRYAAAKERVQFFRAFNAVKSIEKTVGTYVVGIPDLTVDQGGSENLPGAERLLIYYRGIGDPPDSWTLHPDVKLDGTDTGRPSTSHPNCQNFPKRKAEKVLGVTDIYSSRKRKKGGVILGSDLSQIEVRVLVCDAGETELAAAINAGKDVHTYNAARRHKIPEEKVTKELRTPIKETTFGVIYGQGVASIAQRCHISVEEATAVRDGLFALLPRTKAHIEAQHAFVKKHGYVENRFGRRRYIAQVNSSDGGEVAEGLRQAVNTPIQGTASDMCESATARAWAYMKKIRLDVLPFDLIHDANYWDCGPGTVFDAIEIIYYQMALLPMKLWSWCVVKPETEFDIGADWGSMCEAKLIWEGGELDHYRLDLRAKSDPLDRLCGQLEMAGGLTVLETGPHPNAEEAKKGYLRRIIHIDRPEPKALIVGGNLIGPDGTAYTF